MNRAVEQNVRQSAQRLREVWEGSSLLSGLEFDLTQAVYELETGRVKFLH